VAAAGSRWRGGEGKGLGFGDEIQRMWFAAPISNIGRWVEKTSGRYIGFTRGVILPI
jgi:hypothetical protein